MIRTLTHAGRVRHPFFARRFASLAGLAIAGLAWAAVLPVGAVKAKDLLTPAEAERLGLVESWHRQAGTIGGAAAIVDIQLWVQKSVKREMVEVVAKGDAAGSGVLERIATNQKDLMGRTIGKADAERRAKLSVIKLKRRGVEADVRTVTVDEVRLYVLTADGGLAAYDAETGQEIWSLRLGQPSLGYGTLGINDQWVTVLNGSTMHQVSAMEVETIDPVGLRVVIPAGRPAQSKRIDGVPLHGAVNSGKHALVTTTRKGMETYLLGEPTVEPGFEMFSGKAISKPSTFPNSTRVMWPTDSGFVYAVETEGRPSSLFRLKLDGTAEGGIAAASDDRFFFATTGGRVYAVRATETGEVLWNQSLGEPFYRAPFISGNRLVVSSGYGNLHCLNLENGTPMWDQPSTDVDQIFAHVGERFIGRDREQHLMVIDEKTGDLALRMRNVSIEKVITNQDTDRFYMAGKGGMIQCLRPFDSELPVFLREIKSAPAPATGTAAETKPADKAAGPGPVADPFGGDAGADPFGGDAGADPFGGDAGADPFGGGAEDPFGN
jgi:outer membrane protein assembly factor BamB